ncbi:aminodeoxychorismate lyase [Candidatus Riesia pediculischaeffi]|uniref:Aminodeoxychorismate lyase n=1 Tax=Candidatus Riesia pediculischaeffi PTSU TaxID=1401651 RepID=A0A0C1VJQ7_9ENTR|nr:aminodeoxychorismate lyase [Candidatus Riesia pediculischaeffi]KIE64095.1 Aminodeoxychorismate lyase [Candidatus Riesia pediculischaeffi PTSU]
MSIHWINGKKNHLLSIDDRSIHFGDGFFTTIMVKNREPLFIDDHLKRLRISPDLLFIDGVNWKNVKKGIFNAASYNEDDLAVIKVIISRGECKRGYWKTCLPFPNLIISLTEYPEDYHKKRKNGIDLTFSTFRISRNHRLSRIKHLNRLEQVLIKRESVSYEFDECIVLDTEGNLVGCCASNIFFRTMDRVCTPDLFYSGVEGITRGRIIDILKSTRYRIVYTNDSLKEFLSSEEIFISNSLMPIFTINRILSHDRKRTIWKKKSRDLFDFLVPIIL